MTSTECEFCKADSSQQTQKCFLCQKSMCFNCVTQDECIPRDLFNQMPFWACWKCRNEIKEIEQKNSSSCSCNKDDSSQINEEMSFDQRTWVCHCCPDDDNTNIPGKCYGTSSVEKVTKALDVVNFEKDLDEIMMSFFGEALRFEDAEEWAKIESEEVPATIEEEIVGNYIDNNEEIKERQADNDVLITEEENNEAKDVGVLTRRITDDETHDGKKIRHQSVTDDEKVSNLFDEAAELFKFAPENERAFLEAILLKSLPRFDSSQDSNEENPQDTPNTLEETGAIKRQSKTEEPNMLRSKAWGVHRHLDNVELDDVLLSPTSFTSENVEFGSDVENEDLVPRKSDIEDAASCFREAGVIPRKSNSEEVGLCEEATGFGHAGPADFRSEDRIQAAIDAIRTVGVIERDIRKITVQTLKLCVEEKIECLLRVYEDLNKLN